MQQLKIKSSHRKDPNSSPGDFYLALTKPIQGKWALRQVFICADFPNINSRNNRIPFMELGVSKVATIPIGYYTSSQIVTALQNALNTASGGVNTYTCTLNPVTQQVTITGTVAFTLQWASSPGSSAAATLGFQEKDTFLAISCTAQSIVVANSIMSFNITIDGCGSIMDSRGNISSFDVPMITNVNPLSFMVYEPDLFQQIIAFKDSQRVLHIRVCDDDGRPLDLKQNWSMIWESLDAPWQQ